MSPEVIVLGGATAVEGNLDTLLELSLEHVARSRTEPGCLHHEVTRSVEDPNTLRFVERWADLDVLKAHFTVPATREFSTEVVRLTGGAVTLSAYSVDELSI